MAIPRIHPLSLALVVATATACPQASDDDGATSMPFGTGDEPDPDDPDDDDDDDDDGGSNDGGSSDDGSNDGSNDDGSNSSSPPPPPPPDEPPGVCGDPGDPCESTNECCDFESGEALCVDDGVDTLCHSTCDYPEECNSECCAPLQSGEHACAAMVVCEDIGSGACVDPGYGCEVNGYCCGFAAGDALCVNFPDESVCAATCSVGSDCWSGCCVELDNGAGACASDIYCAGNEGGEPGSLAAAGASEAPRVDQAHTPVG